MRPKYHEPYFNPDALSKHNIDRMALEEIPDKSLVLDLGCATGFMGKYLREKKHCRVIGVDVRPIEAAIARKNLDKVVVADLERDDWETKVKRKVNKKKFDVVLATSVIEHLSFPKHMLLRAAHLIKPNGRFIVTTPNIAHWSIRLSLLQGKFEYTRYGILDETHLHFFTKKTFHEIFTKNGFMIEKTRIDAEGGGFPRISIFLSRFFPNLFAYQLLVVARKRSVRREKRKVA